MASTSTLFTPLKVGDTELKHRVVLAPLTRFRSTKKAHVPLDFVTTYYGQRASRPGTLLITEATFIAPQAGGYDHVPGIWSDEQITAWKRVTDEVHSRGSYIFVQLWALGRAAAPKIIREDGYDYVSSSPTPFKKDPLITETPRALTEEEIKEYVGLYAQAAENAIKAGFDGVEIHGANGYLIDQFIQDVVNTRTDSYGGSIPARSKFALEVVDAIVSRIGAARTGIRFSPFSIGQEMRMADPIPQYSHLLSELAKQHPDLAYVHFIEPRVVRFARDRDYEIIETSDSLDFARNIWRPTGSAFLSAGGFVPETALRHYDIPGRENEAVVFGRWFISNPDLPRRIQENIPLTPYDRSTFYLKESTKGYIDYTFVDDEKVSSETRVNPRSHL